VLEFLPESYPLSISISRDTNFSYHFILHSLLKMGSTGDLPKTYKGVVYDEPGKVSTKIVDLDMPEPGPGEVLINLTHSGVCHSDLGVMTNRWAGLPAPTQAGQVGGHEGVGKIVKMGPGTETSSVKLGDRVGIKWISAICGSCPACLSGHDGVCFNQKVSGYYTPGTFQQYVLGPANYVTPVPESLPSDAAAPMLCAGVTVYSALRKSSAKSGDWVVLLGAGGGLGMLRTGHSRVHGMLADHPIPSYRSSGHADCFPGHEHARDWH